VSLSAVLFRNRRLAAGLLAGVAVATLAACSSKDDSSGGSTTTPANGSNGGPGGGGGAMSAYFQCLQQNGVTMSGPGGGAPPSGAPGGAAPSGAPGGGNGGPGGNGTPPSGAPGGANGGPGGAMTISKPDGVSDEVWTKAQTACSSLAPSAAAPATATS
jgi:hypothetical protein